MEVYAIRRGRLDTPFHHHRGGVDAQPFGKGNETIFNDGIQRTIPGKIQVTDGELHVWVMLRVVRFAVFTNEASTRGHLLKLY